MVKEKLIKHIPRQFNVLKTSPIAIAAKNDKSDTLFTNSRTFFLSFLSHLSAQYSLIFKGF